jgi:hypothetical protein
MSGQLYQKVLEHYEIAHLRENPKPVQTLTSAVNMATGPWYLGALKASQLRAQHYKQYPFLKRPAEFGVRYLLSHEHIMAKMLQQLLVDGYFRRKCDVLAHLLDWEENERQTKVAKAHFVRLLQSVLHAMDRKIVWPLMILKAFMDVFDKTTPALEKASDWRYESLAWLFIVEPVPEIYQARDERAIDMEKVAHHFRMGDDDTKALPLGKVAGRVQPKQPDLFAQMAAALTLPKSAFQLADGALDNLEHRGIKTTHDAKGKLQAVKQSDEAAEAAKAAKAAKKQRTK